VERVEERDAGDGAGIGSCYLVEWRSRVLYSLSFEFTVERVGPPRLMAGVARGELAGKGTWRLFEQDGVTAVVYGWGRDDEPLDEPRRPGRPARVSSTTTTS
jgi:hypothetical protein